MNAPTSSAPAAPALLWAARVSAIALAGFWALFALGECLPPLPRQPLSVQLLFAGWAAVFVGYAAGWRRPALGGAIVVAAMVFMYAVGLVGSGRLLGPWFLLWLVPGLLYLAAARAARLTRAPA